MKKTLQAGQPHVAYVVLWYPLFTQPFIYREVEELSRLMPVQVYALYGSNLRHCSQEMRENHVEVINYGLRSFPKVMARIFSELFTHPIRLARLFKRSCLRKWSNLEIFAENLWGFCTGISLGYAFKEAGIDLVYSPWPRGATTAAWVAASMAELPFAFAVRGDNLAPADPDLQDKLAAACAIRANNAADQERIEKFGNAPAKGKTSLVYNSLSLPSAPREQGGAPIHDPVRLLAVGRFDVTKGFDVLLKACALLKAEGFPFRLTLAGGGGKRMGLGKLEGQLHALRKELNLEKEVSMPGLVSHDAMPGLFREHDIFVAPCIIHESGKRDGIPNTIIEAMAAGLPVISSRINAIPEVVRDSETGILIEPGNPASLARAIATLAKEPEQCSRLGMQGASLAAELFAPAGNAQKLADLLTSASKCKTTAGA